jgi:predicted tellurium resistance membrane protein TerC
MEWLHPEALIALLTLTVLEIVLGIDNIIFISIVSGRLPEAQQPRARNIGLLLAMFMRIGLLFSISWIVGLTAPLFEVFGYHVSGRDLILLVGGLFLLAKATHEIHNKLEGTEEHSVTKIPPSFTSVIVQIMLLDIVFSLDSVITAVGMADELWVMVTAVVISIGIMLVAAGPISRFVDRHPTVKILALSFLLLIGMSLVAESFHQHIPKGYIYFAMGFSVLVEMLNLRVRTHQNPVALKGRINQEVLPERPAV